MAVAYHKCTPEAGAIAFSRPPLPLPWGTFSNLNSSQIKLISLHGTSELMDGPMTSKELKRKEYKSSCGGIMGNVNGF